MDIGVSVINPVQPDSMDPAAIHHEAPDLFEKVKNHKPLFILSDGVEKPVNQCKNLYAAQMRYNNASPALPLNFSLVVFISLICSSLLRHL